MGIANSILSRIPWVSQIREAAATSTPDTPLKEEAPGIGVFAYGYGADSDDHLYRKLSQNERELPTVIQERALRLSWWLYESNPLARGIIEMMKDHVVGKGFSVQSADPAVQKVIDRHWEDSVNQWDIKQNDRVRDLGIFGELILACFVNKANGHVRLASIDPAHVRGVYTSPDNPEEITTIVVNPRRTLAGFRNTDQIYRVVHMDEDPNSDTYGRYVGAQEGESFTPAGGKKAYGYTGSCFYFSINKITGSTRGRGDLLSIIDWLDSYDQLLFNFADRALLMNSFVWDVTVNGATESQLNTWRTKHAATPRPGTVNVHNEGEKWESVSPQLRQQDFAVQQKTLKAQILSAPGMPPHWFGEDDANRATATEMGHPAMKRLESRQLLVRNILRQIIRFVLDQAVIAGTLPNPKVTGDVPSTAKIEEADPTTTVGTSSSQSGPLSAEYGGGAASGSGAKKPLPEEYKFQIAVPEMSARDLTTASNSMMNVVQSLVIAMTAGIIDLVEAQRIFTLISSELGVDINLDAMVQRLHAMGIDEFQGDGSIDKEDPSDPDKQDSSAENKAALDKQRGARDTGKEPIGNNRKKPTTPAARQRESVLDAMAVLAGLSTLRD